MGGKEFNELPRTSEIVGFFYALEVYVDDFMSIVIPTSREQLEHVATAIMMGLQRIFCRRFLAGAKDDLIPIAFRERRCMD
jgi:hypothetical protein